MSRRIIAVTVAAAVIFSCSQEGGGPTTTTTTTTSTTLPPTTTTTAPPTTTTTKPPFTVKNAPPRLTKLVEHFYRYAVGRAKKAPAAPKPVIAAIEPRRKKVPRRGVASVGAFQGWRVATVEMGKDVFLAVDDGKGWRIVGGNWPSVKVPAYYGPSPRLVVVVGTDARPWEEMTTALTDSIHFIGLDGKGGGGIVGVPRDSWVPINGGGRSKINVSLNWGGFDGMMRTFHDLTGLPVEGYVLTGFHGFQEMLGNVLGGIDLVVPYPLYDSASGAAFEPGAQYVNGPEALSFARARKSLPRGDFTRSANQGLVLIDAAKNLRHKGYGAIPRLMEMSEPFMATNLNPEALLTFAALVIGSDLDTMPNLVVPGSTGTAGSASVVYLSPSVSEVWADLADGKLGN